MILNSGNGNEFARSPNNPAEKRGKTKEKTSEIPYQTLKFLPLKISVFPARKHPARISVDDTTEKLYILLWKTFCFEERELNYIE